MTEDCTWEHAYVDAVELQNYEVNPPPPGDMSLEESKLLGIAKDM